MFLTDALLKSFKHPHADLCWPSAAVSTLDYLLKYLTWKRWHGVYDYGVWLCLASCCSYDKIWEILSTILKKNIFFIDPYDFQEPQRNSWSFQSRYYKLYKLYKYKLSIHKLKDVQFIFYAFYSFASTYHNIRPYIWCLKGC